MGYDPRHVDSFLAHIGAGFASGIDSEILATSVLSVRFPMVTKGYEPHRIDEQLRTLAAQLRRSQQSDVEVIERFISAA